MARRLLSIALCLCSACLAADLRYPVPPGAKDQHHVRLSDTGGEQDYFAIVQVYPSTSVLDHYRNVFAQWTECKPAEPGWQSFGDVSGTKPRFVHQLLREWVRSDNKSVVTLGVMYYSEGSQHRVRPDSDTQRVVLIEYEVPDGRAAAEYLGYKCNGA
jgi:hypothetical protein